MASSFNGMFTSTIAVLSTTQIAAFTTADYLGITSDQIAALKTNQIQAIETRDLAVLTTAQIAQGFRTDQIAALTTLQVAQGFSTAQIAALTTDQIKLGLTTDQVVALTTAQANALSTAQIQSLTTLQISALETRDLIALKTSQIVALTTEQMALGFTTLQCFALTTTQTMALTSDQFNALALNTDQFGALHLGTPLVLDLNGDGITTQSIEGGVKFDLLATGQKVSTGWVAGGDGLLVMDRNHDGVINDGSELFGSATSLPTGERAANGYVALSALDSNGDGLITSADAGFSDLRVWADANSDGVSQTGEIRTLDSLGITKLDLAATVSGFNNNGNFEGLVSGYETTDGATHAMADVWFVADTSMPDVAVSTVTPTEDLRSKVGGLVQAIGAFNESQSVSASTSTMPGVALPPAASTSGILGGATNVGGVVDVLKQFDPNGNLVAVAGGVQSVPGVTSPMPSNLLIANTGILATGK